MSAWTSIYDIIKTGFFLAIGVGVGWLIIWSIRRNIQWMFRGRKPNQKIVYWFIDGLSKGYDEDELMQVLGDKGYNLKEIEKALRAAYKIMIKEEEVKNAKKERKLDSPEEEVSRSKEREQRASGKTR